MNRLRSPVRASIAASISCKSESSDGTGDGEETRSISMVDAITRHVVQALDSRIAGLHQCESAHNLVLHDERRQEESKNLALRWSA